MKAWKRFLAMVCVVSLITKIPGVIVLADDLEDNSFITENTIERIDSTDEQLMDESISDELIVNEENESKESDMFDEEQTDSITMIDDTSSESEIPEASTDSDVSISDNESDMSLNDVVDALPERDQILNDEESPVIEQSVGANSFTVGDGVTAKIVVEKGKNVLYFNSKGGTLWSNWRSKLGDVTRTINTIKFTKDSTKMYFPENSRGLFAGGEKTYYSLLDIEEIDLQKVDTSRVKDMGYMFDYCWNLKELDLSSFNTSNVTSMDSMFYSCRRLTKLDLSNLNTSSVTNMLEMFYGCENLINLDLSDFDTSKVTNFGAMFSGCKNLKKLNLSNFNTRKVTSIYSMFKECTNLTFLDISSFDLSNVTPNPYYGPFADDKNLQVLITPKKNTKSIALPFTMYDSSGKSYSSLPTLSKSIVLAKTKQIALMEEDPDKDGISTKWEKNGADVNDDGIIDINFPQMGANPSVPDIFVEIDWMEGLKPRESALRIVYNQFKNHGINLHLDAGSNSIDYVNGKRWGTKSGGNSIPYSKNFKLGKNNSNWIKTAEANFSSNRFSTFRYCLFVNEYNGSGSSGIANDIPGQFFIVADVDGWISETDIAQAGTFMHELGHTLGLRHGGDDNTNLKPNYLSIMNYSFQTTGLVGTNEVNYSDYVLPAIDENNLNENTGIDPKGVTKGTGIGTKWYFYHYHTNGSALMRLMFSGQQKNEDRSISKRFVDFNCNGAVETGVKEDLNNDGKKTTIPASINDWKNISYCAGAIGSGQSVNPENFKIPVSKNHEVENELTKEMAKEYDLRSNVAPAFLDFDNTDVRKTIEDSAFTNPLISITDGTIRFKSSNTNVAVVNSKTGKVTIKEVGTTTISATSTKTVNYRSGSASYKLTVTKRIDIKDCTASTKYKVYEYTGNYRQPALILKLGSATLVKGTDYTLSYKNNKNVGTATVTATGIGKYKGTKSCTFYIKELVPVYRLFNTRTGEHFYTASTSERQKYLNVGSWNAEGIAWYAPKKSSEPIYRLSNPNNGNEHHYTKSKSEKDWLVGLGWRYDCIAWYSDTDKLVPIYRHYHPIQRTGNHHYTTSKGESDHIVKYEGWRYEGISFYVSKAGG